MLSAEHRALLAEMAADAIDLRLSSLQQPCPDCDRAIAAGDRFPACEQHQADVAQADLYRRLARMLGADVS